MKLITRFELACLSEVELHGLYRKVFNELARSQTASAERRACLACLDNIEAELKYRFTL